MINRKLTFLGVVTVALWAQSCALHQGQSEKQGLQEDLPIDIQFVLPPGSDDPFAYEPEGGWPLTLRLTADERQLLGIGSVHTPRFFPAREESAFLVFSDPDECYSWVDENYQDIHQEHLDEFGESDVYPKCLQPPQTIPWLKDEIWVEITPGLSYPDPDTCGQRPEVLKFNPETSENDKLTPIGPCVGSSLDGYGYGWSERLPGLVVVADTGPGVVFDEDMNRPVQYEARNLAGFLNTVGYHLKDHQTRTSILANLLVPEKLFSPIVAADFFSDCPEDEAWIRVDGGDTECIDADQVDDIFDQQVTLRAFVVNEPAPSILTDLNDDGVVSLADATAAGLMVISNETLLRFQQVHEDEDGLLIFFDANGDGKAILVNLPGGPGQLTPPPR